MAGTCEVATPAMILAMFLVLPFILAAIALGRAATREHHLGVIFLGRAGHDRGNVLEGQAVGRGELRGVIDIAAEPQHLIPIALEDRLLLLRRHRKAVEIGALVFLECRAALRGHHRHAEHVEMIALARAPGVEDIGPRYVVVGFLFFRQITSPNRAASDYPPATPVVAPRWARYGGSYPPARHHRAYGSSCWGAANPYPTTPDR